MKTEIKINPLPKHIRVGSDIEKPKTICVEGHLSDDEVFAIVYPDAAAKGHGAQSRLNGLQDYSYTHHGD